MTFLMAQREPCPFCENFAGRPNPTAGPPSVLYEDAQAMSYLNVASHGGMPGHALVVPKRHVGTILDLTHEEEAHLAHLVAKTARVLTAALEPDGLMIVQRNGLAAEQTVPHVHFHVIPRRAGTLWPPTEWIEMGPIDERHALAARIRSLW